MKNHMIILAACMCQIAIATLAGQKRNREDTPSTRPSSKRLRTFFSQEELDRQLLNASKSEPAEKIFDLLIQDANTYTVDAGGATPLHYAADRGALEVVTILIQHFANVNTRDNTGWTPLHAASLNGHAPVVEALIQHGAKLDAALKTATIAATPANSGIEVANFNGATPLHQAAANNRAQVAQLLVEAGAQTDKRNQNGETPLLVATQNGSMQVFDTLLKAGANPNLAMPSGITPLHIVASYGNQKAVADLLKAGACKYAIDKTEWTALHFAAQHGQCRVMEQLLHAGINPIGEGEKLTAITPLELYYVYMAQTLKPPSAFFTKLIQRSIHNVASNGDTILHRLFARQNGLNLVLTSHVLLNDHTKILDIGRKNMDGENVLHIGASRDPKLLSHFLQHLFFTLPVEKQAQLMRATTPCGDTVASLAPEGLCDLFGKEPATPNRGWTLLMHRAYEITELTPRAKRALIRTLNQCLDPAYVTDTFDSALSVASCEEVKDLLRKTIREQRREDISVYLETTYNQPRDLADLLLKFTGTYEASQLQAVAQDTAEAS